MHGKEQEDSELNEALGPDLSPNQPDAKVALRPTTAEFNKIFEWFTDPHSRDLHSRQILAVEKFCKKFTDGFFLADLSNIQKILEILVSKISLNAGFASPIISVLKSCSIPFAVQHTSDLWNCRQSIISILSYIGNMLLLNLPLAILHQIVKTLREHVVRNQLNPEEDYLLSHHCIHQTDVAGVLSQALTKFVSLTKEKDFTKEEHEFLLDIVNTIKELSFYKVHVDKMNLPVTIKNFLLVSKKLETEAQETTTDIILQTIQLSLDSQTFLNELDYSHLLSYCLPSVLDQEMNTSATDLLLVILQVAKIPQSWPHFANTGVLQNIISKLHDELMKQETQVTETRIERINFFILIFRAVLGSIECLSIVKSSEILNTFLLYIDTSNPMPTISKWKPNQISSLRNQIIGLLFHLAPLCLEKFLKIGGIETLLKWIRPGTSDNVKSALTVLLACLSKLNSEQINKQQSTVAYIKDILAKQLPDSISCDMISAISLLCSSKKNRKVFIEGNGISLLVSYVKNYRRRYLELAPNSELYIATILDCIWICLKNSKDIKKFTEEGIDTIVNLLEDRQNTSLNNQTLNFLVDIAAENSNIIKSLKQWKSERNQCSISRLLISLWIDEEKRLGIVLSDVVEEEKKPLGQSTVKALNHDFNTTDMRRSIFSLLKHLHFFVGSDLNASERSKLHLIKYFLDFRTAEVWDEIYQELINESIVPVRLDQKAIDRVLNNSIGLAKKVQEYQQSIVQEQQKLDLQEEQKFYDAIRYHTQVRQKVEITSLLSVRTAK